jgi:predicted nucleotidyltransferase
MTLDQPQAFVQRFTAACQTDERVVAAFLGGSHAAGTADTYADLDLYVIISDEAYDAFFTERQAFMHRLGEPLFLEDFNAFGFDMLNFIFANDADGELALARASHFTHIHGGPFTPLVDKQGVLAGAVFPLFDILPTAESRGIPPPSRARVPGSSVAAFPDSIQVWSYAASPGSHRLPSGGKPQPFG